MTNIKIEGFKFSDCQRFELSPIDNHKSFYGKAYVYKSRKHERMYVCVSYNIPVAAYIDGDFYRLWGDYSDTTKRHINSFRVNVCNLPSISKAEYLALPVAHFSF